MSVIICTLSLLIMLLKYRRNIDVLIILVSVYLIAVLVPFLYTEFVETEVILNRSIISILSLNFLLFLFLIRFGFKPSKAKVELFSELRIKFNSRAIAVENLVRGNEGVFFYLLLFLTGLKFVSLINLDFFELGESRTDAWAQSVSVEASEGMGLAGISGYVSYMLFIFLVTYFLNFGNAVIRKRVFYVFISYQILLILETILVGLYRSPLIFDTIFTFVVTHFYYKEINRKIINFGLILSIVLVPLYFSFAGYVREGNSSDVSIEDINMLHGLSGLATTYDFADLSSRLNSGSTDFEYGKQYLYNFFSWVPRSVWRSKPQTSFSFRKSGEFFGTIGEDAWVHTYTPWGEGFAQFGFVGALLSTVQIFILIFILYEFLGRSFRLIVFKLFILSFPILLRGDLSSFYAAFYKVLSASFIIIILLSFIKFLIKKNYVIVR